ncbi:hypothetical protein D3C81_1950110 [compost metagenome]
MHVGIAQRLQHRCSARREVFAGVLAVDHDQRVAARDARPRFQFELRQREVGGPQRVLLRERVFLAHVDQCDLGAGQQGLAYLRMGEGRECRGGLRGGWRGELDGHDFEISRERSHRLGRVGLESPETKGLRGPSSA